MAKTLTLTTAARNAAANGVVDLFDPVGAANRGEVHIYNSGVGTGTKVVLDFGSTPAFGAAATGVATLSTLPITATSTVTIATANKFQAMDDANTPVKVFDGNVGVGTTFTMNISNTAINSGDKVSLTAFTYTQPAT